MLESVNNFIAQLSRFVAWLGSISIDGSITFFDIAFWFLVLRLIPVLMKMISNLSKKRSRSNFRKV